MKILAFGASNSKNSINEQLASYVAETFKTEVYNTVEIELLDLTDFELPFYRADREETDGIPAKAKEFYDKISSADALIISLAEHNGSYTAAYKNLFDWTTRIDIKVYQDKPTILLSTSPGKGGAQSVLKAANDSAGYFGMDIKASISVPSFFENFDGERNVITNDDIKATVINAVKALKE